MLLELPPSVTIAVVSDDSQKLVLLKKGRVFDKGIFTYAVESLPWSVTTSANSVDAAKTFPNDAPMAYEAFAA